MRLIIAGSRDITDYEIVRNAVISSGLWKLHKHDLEIVCGMARGVDMLGWTFADRNGLNIHEFPAKWKKPNGSIDYSAGYKRNKLMGNFSDELLAIWDGRSSGTFGMIEYMKSIQKPFHVVIVK